MAQGFEHIAQILAFISDNSQVVSYKWLSRKFSISSNEAKRLLHIFVDEHGSSVEVVYAVLGWSKTEPRHYSVQLVPKSKLQQAKDMVEGDVSYHVYSVQPCIPKDSAELWSVEYVQLEELSNQAFELSNSLRDNRFSAVSCLSVTRKVMGRTSVKATIKDPKASAPSAPLVSPCNSLIIHDEVAPASLATSECQSPRAPGTNIKDTGRALQESATTGTAMQSVNKVPIKKKEAGSVLQGGGSLTSLWGRASNKPKTQLHESHVSDVRTTAAGDAEPIVHANDDLFDSSSGDDASDFAHLRRGQVKSGSGRKRRVVFEDEISDVENEENGSGNIVSLASPEVLKERPESTAIQCKNEVEKSLEDAFEEADQQGKVKVTHGRKKGGTALNGKQASSTRGSNKKVTDPVGKKGDDCGKNTKHDDIKVDDASLSNQGAESVRQTSPTPKSGQKKRKVLKTHIDNRGREVTEVVWENENAESNEKDEVLPRDTGAPVQTKELNRSLASGNPKLSNAAHDPPTKGTNKSSGKTAVKDSQQGKILSFFKKV